MQAGFRPGIMHKNRGTKRASPQCLHFVSSRSHKMPQEEENWENEPEACTVGG